MKKTVLFIVSCAAVLVSLILGIVLAVPSMNARQKAVARYVAAVNSGKAAKLNAVSNGSNFSAFFGDGTSFTDSKEGDPRLSLLRQSGIDCPPALLESSGDEDVETSDKSKATLLKVKIIGFEPTDGQDGGLMQLSGSVTALIRVEYRDVNGKKQTYDSANVFTVTKSGSKWGVLSVS